ncbi:AhpD family alkylhydroperoxidase [Arthrobacter silviterrae]|uniref:Carboxymuconolactone decarboxylase family protein n=1 Tax=Arthrobacter silviterrae TaxID=2026658 RepID=A0ABX0DAU7_9MICC|nr:carboxymuconolactone decarboxylase family protein [Arthrobacter silviterrae]MDQ0278831.1 AhpD family alkylhydroperoxidase [Arthrobacter silviterrae]NGN83998.1 carboxymuconolactone decarboxylase family protein [Arthrobacter silviterrae]
MPRIPAQTVATAPEGSREAARKLEKKMGKLLNIHAGMAHSPAVIASYTGIGAAIAAHGTFDARIREAIALAVGNQNGCDYCQAAHTLSARRAGLDDGQILQIRAGEVDFDEKIETITAVAREAAANTGNVSAATWEAALSAGWSADDLAEAFAHIAANLFTNYFNHYAGTELDLPPAPDLNA